MVLMAILSLVLTGREVPLILTFDRLLTKETFRFGLKSYLQNLVGSLNYRLDVYILAFFLTPKQVAFYGVATSLAEVAWYIPNSVGVVLFPRPQLCGGGAFSPAVQHADGTGPSDHGQGLPQHVGDYGLDCDGDAGCELAPGASGLWGGLPCHRAAIIDPATRGSIHGPLQSAQPQLYQPEPAAGFDPGLERGIDTQRHARFATHPSMGGSGRSDSLHSGVYGGGGGVVNFLFARLQAPLARNSAPLVERVDQALAMGQRQFSKSVAQSADLKSGTPEQDFL